MTIRSADGTTLAVNRTGDGPALIMIDPAGAFHGLRPMAAAVGPLAQQFTVYTYDRRGRGDSGDITPFTPQREVDDLAAIIEAAGGPVSVHGFSSGAALALAAAAGEVSIEKLALLEPPFAVDQPSDEAFKAEVGSLVERGERGRAVEFFHRGVGVPDEYIDGLRDHPAWPKLAELAHTYLYDLAILELMTTGLLSSVRQPMLVVSSAHSDEYLRACAVDVASRLPDGRHQVVPGQWHGLNEEDLARVLTAWLR